MNFLKDKEMDTPTDIVFCPVCDCECCHIEKVSVYPIKGKKEYVINKSGVSSAKHFPDLGMRGALIKIQMFCEYGHIFDLKFQFHKGETTLTWAKSGDYDGMSKKNKDDLWRN